MTDLFRTKDGPLAKARICVLCGHVELVRKGGIGRGYGFRAGNQARGRMIAHLKSAHPQEYARDIHPEDYHVTDEGERIFIPRPRQ